MALGNTFLASTSRISQRLFNFVACNPCQSSPSLLLSGLLLSLCFSTFVKHYFQVSFNLKINLSMIKIPQNIVT